MLTSATVKAEVILLRPSYRPRWYLLNMIPGPGQISGLRHKWHLYLRHSTSAARWWCQPTWQYGTSVLSEKHQMLLMTTAQDSSSACPYCYSVRVRPPGAGQSRKGQDVGPTSISPPSCPPLLPYKYPLFTRNNSYPLLFFLVLSICWLSRRSDPRREAPPLTSDKRIHNTSLERGLIQVGSDTYQKSPL